jgi:GT2 family glycosyltransferase
MNSKVVYTVIVGGYDTLKKIREKTEGWDYICFTDNVSQLQEDNPETSKDWEIRPIPVAIMNHYRLYVEQEDLPEQYADHLISREVKIMYHQYVGHYQKSIYIDAACEVCGNLDYFLGDKQSNPIYVARHPKRNNAFEELELIKKKQLEVRSFDMIKDTMLVYNSEQKIKNAKLFDGSCIIRHHGSRALKKAMIDWMIAVKLFCRRDQVFLPIILLKHGLLPDQPIVFSQIREFFPRKHHKKRDFVHNQINYIISYGYDKKIGNYLNKIVGKFPDSDYICIMDGDTMFFENDFGDYLNEVVNRYPDTHLFGCMTNRLGLDYQLHGGKINNNPSVLYHKDIAVARRMEHGTDAELINRPVAGFFMLARAMIFKEIGFQKEIVNPDGRYFDYDFGQRLLAKNGEIRLIKGLYMFHYYRFHKNAKDTRHIK